ncbi:MAG: hypothetical protein ICV74_10105 [Thermoleophilia bacterium]|nr:hypothetical protein [Thermoleophilia bacterium]
MEALAEVFDWLNLALFTLVAIVALRQWRAGRGRGALWAALTFGALAFVADVGRLVPDDSGTLAEQIARRALIAVLVLFPYLLYRFTTAFEPPTHRLERLLGAMTAVLLVWTLVLPNVPAEGEPRSTSFLAYLAAFLVHWAVLSVVVAVRLWRAGARAPTVARRRMQMLTFAAISLTLVLFLVAFQPPGRPSAFDFAVALLTSASALAFLLALSPPWMLRIAWRRREQARFQDAITRLMRATTEDEVARDVAPALAGMMGARAVALRDEGGRLIGSCGDVEAAERDASQGEAIDLEVPGGSVRVWTSRYAPFFGAEELQLLRTLGALTGLALDRSRLFSRERASRLALERADEVKTSFVALAAHELRTPVATIDGIVETLVSRGPELRPEQRAILEQTLVHQSAHMRTLVDQLLDLSRLDAEAIAIEPERVQVRERVEALVAAAGMVDQGVLVDVDPALEVLADPHAFDRIVSNLVVNALRHGESPVLVHAEQHDGHFGLTVEDSGRGVPPEFVPDLFERFTRARRAGERVAGTGLGLAIARSYARAHGGDLLYENASPQGARFRLVLPATPPGDSAA